MKQYLRVTSVVPPGGFKAKCPQCGYRIWAQTFPDWQREIEKHNAANGHEAWDYVTQLCENLPPGNCMSEDGSDSKNHLCEMRGTDLLAGARAVTAMLVEMAFGGDVFVDQGEAERRASICARCPKNVPVEGCGSCQTMQNAKELLSKVKGPRTTTSDQWLQGCCCCSCDLKTIVHLKKHILDRGFTEAQKKISPDFCWKLEPA